MTHRSRFASTHDTLSIAIPTTCSGPSSTAKSRFNLATSGVGAFPLRELPVTIDELEINGDNSYGFAPLHHAIATKHGVDPDVCRRSRRHLDGELSRDGGSDRSRR